MNHLSIIRNAVLGAAVLIALVASTYQLTEAPGIWYDEGFYTQIGMNFAEGYGETLQIAPDVFVPASYITVGYPLIAPLALSYHFFGIGVLQGRAVMVIFILGLIGASYFLTRQLFGHWSATWTTLLLATFAMLYGNGKSVLGEVPGIFFLTLSLLALYYLEKTQYRDWRGYVLLGLTAGLCAATKPLFILLLGALFITLLIRWRKITLNWKGVLLGFVALGVTMGLWAYLQFGSDATVGSVLADYANPYATQDIGALVIQNALRFIEESTPLYTAILMIVWGAALYARRKSKNISAAEIAAFTFCILTILSYLRLAGWYRYLFPATIVALMFFPASLQTSVDYYLARIARLPRIYLARLSLVGVPLCLTFLAAFQLYQTAHSSYVAQYYNATRTHDVSAVLRSIDPSASIFLYNVPELAILVPSQNYYQYLEPAPQLYIGEHELSMLTSAGAEIAITSSDSYTTHPELFAGYRFEQSVDRYTILQKK